MTDSMVTTIEETRCAEHGLRLCSMCSPDCGPAPTPPAGRAVTPEQKRDAVERLLAAWQAKPGLRLGQLLYHAMRDGPDLRAVEDADLVAAVEAFAGEALVTRETWLAERRLLGSCRCGFAPSVVRWT